MRCLANIGYCSVLVLSMLLLSRCGPSASDTVQNFVSPNKMLIASTDTVFDGSQRRLGYVTNFASGTITLVDVREKSVLDNDEQFDSATTPITVGGNPTDIFEWRPDDLADDTVYKLVVLDQKNQLLFIIDQVETTVEEKATLTHRFAALGSQTLALASKPVFSDRGRLSSTTISSITTNADTQNWRVKKSGDGLWKVEGSVSGLQSNRAESGVPYSSDDGNVAFTIFEGDRISTTDDSFLFGTLKASPLPLNGTPETALLINDTLYIGDRDDAEIEVLDLKSLTFATPIVLDDGSGKQVIPSDLATDGEFLLVANHGEGESIFVVDLSDLSVTAFTVGFVTRALLLPSESTIAYFLPTDLLSVFAFDLGTNTLSTPDINMADFPLAAASLVGDEGVSGTALIATADNAVDLVDLDARVRVDTDAGDDSQSIVGSINFDDLDNSGSNPSLSEVIAETGPKQTWVCTFEGVVDGTPGTGGVVADTLFTDATATFSAQKIQIGDALILFPDNPELTESHEIASINSDTELGLLTAPTTPSSNIPYVIRVVGVYTMHGSVSGFQTNRIQEGITATSDNQEITLSINPATVSTPTTQGDHFSFTILQDGITPIDLDGTLPRDIQIFEQKAYVLNQSSNDISVIDIPNLNLESGIN